MSETYDQKPDRAVALLYDGENAPRVTAKGEGKIAEQIFAIAKEHGVPLENDPQLTAILSQIPLGDEIPEALYRAIAEVIAFAYLVSGKRPPGFREESSG
ncbi:MAG: EscU/YscU/HrcU family type III secretion system export apparatus switch protein [Sedimenticola sp.]|uniref:Flagellar biosynthetic protein FlhB n=1 Tax=Sedimenticola thiotaurini TaxID=1543721 RepID=A0A558D268_9GAMM|nr:EscU/YscU/HrcU family type III secretion system export apparatus switch protein [Sedimenticola sp.]TVT55115.1 MAG: flagellar protein FhlB [Sedimenticola thiotaurini]MCW8920941.1 EscU/YscU/HrcU family type III secretion system export apparatus switch protein [Sedimenticola sp.]MCW8947377.1 EscU/YscU/HrcU family type III secretion system export apparatus switch protein [Sedimenticola sp.]MCW8974145.1 EscU/YscU/HrcU family type III secretion system export apparatus switch protein [Sedimenticola